METKKRFKMYKSGKKWLVAGIIAGGMATVGTVGNAHADEVKTDATVQTEQVSSAAQPTSEAASTSSSATAASSVASSSAVSSAASSSASSVASSAVSGASSSAASAASSSAKDANVKKDQNIKYSGKLGTSNWKIDSQNNLYIEAGDLNSETAGGNSWTDSQDMWDDKYDARSEIKNIYINGPVYLKGVGSEDLFSEYENLENIYGSKNIKTDYVNRIYFNYNPKLKGLDVTGWNVSNITNLSNAFSSDESLIELKGISGWDTSKVTDLSFMFSGSNVQNLDLSGWNVRNVRSYYDMFFGGEFKNLNLSGWNINRSKEQTFGDLFGMIVNRTSIENLNVSGWTITLNGTDKFDPIDFGADYNSLKSITLSKGINNKAIILPEGENWKSSNDGKVYSSESVMELYKNGNGPTATYTLTSDENGTDTTDPGKTDGNKTDGNTNGKTDGNKTDGNTNGNKTDGNKTDGNTNDKTDSNKTDSKADGKTNTNKSQSKDNQSKESTTGTGQKQESKKNTTVVAAKSNDNSSSNNGDGVTTTVTNNASSSEKRQSPQFMKGFLPQTGENNTTASILTVVGVALAGLLASFGIAKKSRKH